jgi:hypothetical protein
MLHLSIGKIDEYRWFFSFIRPKLKFLLRKLIKRSAKRGGEESFSRSFENFLISNTAAWRGFDWENQSKENAPCVMIECLVSHPGYWITNIIIGKYIMRILELPGVALLDRKNKKLELLLESYGITEFHYLHNGEKRARDTMRFILKAIKLSRKIKSIDDFLKLKYEGVYVGKIVYDDYLRQTRLGTIKKVSLFMMYRLVETLRYQDDIEKMFISGDFPIMIQSERQFIPAMILCQVALKHKTVIHSRSGGPTSFIMRRFDDIKQAYSNNFRFSRTLFEYVYKNYRNEAVLKGREYLRKRFDGDRILNDIPEASYSFKKGERIISKSDICDRLGWDVEKPIVAIMANDLTDGVFTNNWNLFRDLLTWLRCTLKAAKKIENVNWVLKPHPSDVRKNVKTTTIREYVKLAKDCKHIKLLPDDVGPNSLIGFIDTVLTVHGSAGIEYSSFGIPCILAGEALCSDRGFTHEPQSQEEYFDLLKNIRFIKPLNKMQIEKAQVFAYIDYLLAKVPCNLIPDYSVFSDYEEQGLWEGAEKMVMKLDPENETLYRMLQIHLKRKDRHILNYDWIGLEKTGF